MKLEGFFALYRIVCSQVAEGNGLQNHQAKASRGFESYHTSKWIFGVVGLSRRSEEPKAGVRISEDPQIEIVQLLTSFN